MPRSRHERKYRLLGLRLRRAREAANRTQVEAARTLGYQQSDISRSEKGQRRIDAFELQEFAAYYRTTVEALLAPEHPDESLELERGLDAAEDM